MEDMKEIGAIAKLLDNEKTVVERMKVERGVLKELGIAFVFYTGVMVLMGLFL